VIPLAEIVEGKALLETVAYSLAAAVGVTASFSIAIYGATRTGELRRDSRLVEAAATGALTVLGLAACAAAIVLAVVVMTSK
jgi:hypothetical protein